MVQDRVILKPAPCRLGCEDHVSERELWDHEVLLPCRFIRPDHNLAWRLAPSLYHLILPRLFEFVEPVEICLDRKQGRCPGCDESLEFSRCPCPDICPVERHHPDKYGFVWYLTFNRVSGLVHAFKNILQTRRNIDVTCTDVILSAAVVVVDHRHLPLAVRNMAEMRPRDCPVAHPVDLLIDRDIRLNGLVRAIPA